MENEDTKSESSSNLESIANRVKEFRRQADGKRPRYPEDFRDEVIAIVASGVKINRICTETGLAYSCVLSWAKKDSKFKPLKVVKVRKRRKKRSKPGPRLLPKKSVHTYGLRFSTGAEIEAIDFEGVARLLERGLL